METYETSERFEPGLRKPLHELDNMIKSRLPDIDGLARGRASDSFIIELEESPGKPRSNLQQAFLKYKKKKQVSRSRLCYQ